jgi:uncharacterized membrane protein
MTDVFVFEGAYRNVEDAQFDYNLVKELHVRGAIDTYDAAVVNKDRDGTVHVSKHEKPTQKGAWTGALAGAVVGVLFPPSIIGMAAAGGAMGGLIGHVWSGMSRSDLKELGDVLDSGTAALVVVGKSSLADKLAKATAKAQKTIEKKMETDEKNFNKELTRFAEALA